MFKSWSREYFSLEIIVIIITARKYCLQALLPVSAASVVSQQVEATSGTVADRSSSSPVSAPGYEQYAFLQISVHNKWKN